MENKGKTLTASTLALLLTEIGAIGESYIGTCNTGMTPSTTVIVSSDLRGYDDDHFNKGWELFVVHKDTAPGTLPQGERRDITDYISSTGAFTTDAFSANVSEDDEIIVARLTSFPFDSMIMGVDPISGSIASFLSSGSGSTVLGARLGIDKSIIDALGHNGVISLGSGVNGNIGDFSAQTNLLTLLAALGIPDVTAKSLYTCLITDRLDSATFGLGALNNDLDALLLDMGDFSAQTNLQTLLTALGIPDVAAKPLYTCLVTDRLDNVTFGLGALNNDLDAIIANQAGAETISSYNLPNDTAENTLLEIINTKRLRLDAVWLDMINLVQNVTIKVYHKIDGTNYRQYDVFSWGTAEEDGVLLSPVTINGDWKVTVTSTVAQGAIKAIPYNVIKTTMEA